MSEHKLPKHVQGYVTPWGKQIYYLRKPGRPKIRIEVADDVLPWSPAFMAALERLIRAEHGEKRTIMMHAKAVQAIASKLSSRMRNAISERRCSISFATTVSRSD